MLKLVIFAEMRSAETALETSPTMIPNSSIAFDTDCVLQWAFTTVNAQAFTPVTNPCLTVITNGALHKQAKRGKLINSNCSRQTLKLESYG